MNNRRFSAGRLLAVSILVLGGVSSLRAQFIDVPELHVPRVNTPVTLTGEMDEDAWKHAARVTLSDPWKQTGHTFEPTEVLVFWTDEAVYIGFLAQDAEILARQTDRDDRTHKDDCVEIYLARPRESLGEALGLEINANGVVADFYYRHPGWVNYGWEPDTVVIKAHWENTFAPGKSASGPGFVTEVKIPWKELLYALPEKEIPHRLRANFSRWDYGTGGRIFSIWSDPQLTKPGPYRPDRFGWLIFDP